MIAKSSRVILFLSFLISVSARAEIKNLYANILNEYDIRPPALQYGYPLWYQYDSLPITGIIFLKKDLDDLYRMDKITYVAEPTKENAEIIFNFSGEIAGHPKFYIVPDSNLTWKEVHGFIQHLKTDNPYSQIELCGGDGVYINYYRKRKGSSCWPISCGNRSILIILQNCSREVLLEGDIISQDQISSHVEEFYLTNKSGQDKNLNSVNWRFVDLNYCTERIQDILEAMEDPEPYCPEDSFYLTEELNKLRSLNYLVSKNGAFSIPEPDAYISVKVQYCDRSIGSFYQFADQVNKGVFLSRQKIAEEIGANYMQLFLAKRMEDLAWVHVQIPDMCYFYFEEDMAPPPYIEIYADPLEIQLDTLKR